MTSRTTILKLKALFGRYGVPYELRTDGAKQFVCKEFAEFAAVYNFKHEVSSPTYARSNGKAEAYMKIAKKCLKTDDPALSLLLYRSTPHAATGVAPATQFLGRQLRTTLPTTTANLRPMWPDESLVRQRDATYKEKMAYFHDRHHGCKSEATFNVGDSVRMKTDRETEWTPATVTCKTQYPRSYMLKTPDGRTLRRNTKHIMPSRAPMYMTHKPDLNDREALFREFLDRRMQSFRVQSPNASSNAENSSKHPVMNKSMDIMKDPVVINSDKTVKNTDKITKKVPLPAVIDQPTVRTRSGRTVRAPRKMDL